MACIGLGANGRRSFIDEPVNQENRMNNGIAQSHEATMKKSNFNFLNFFVALCLCARQINLVAGKQLKDRNYLIVILLILVGFSPAQGAVKTYSLRMPVTAVITESDDSGKTWRRNGIMPVTYMSAVNQMKACLAGQGWIVKQIIPLGRKNDRTLINFEKGKQKITVMIWRMDLAKTGFSWGIIE